MTAATHPRVPKLSSSAIATVGKERVKVLTGFEVPWLEAHAVGYALTVEGTCGDNLALHLALAEAQEGEVLVANVGGELPVAHWGGLMAVAAQHRGLAGVVLNGAIRDRAELAALQFPIFFRGTSPTPPTKRARGQRRVAIKIDGVEINSGDLIAADADGIAILPADAMDVAFAAEASAAAEDALVRRLKEGESLLELLELKR
jgi:4-hydroxy-4-methyl-2-oxoglutarate aldolase